jgi:hypothetical protein
VFAGYGGIVGGKHMRAAERSLRNLVKLMDTADCVMTVELWCIASVASHIMRESEEPGADRTASVTDSG